MGGEGARRGGGKGVSWGNWGRGKLGKGEAWERGVGKRGREGEGDQL